MRDSLVAEQGLLWSVPPAIGSDRRDLIIWAAGFFDGEGCISIALRRERRQNGKVFEYHTMEISATQTHTEPLEIFQSLFGGGLVAKKMQVDHHRQCWKWSVSTREALFALNLMLPFLVVKRPQAELAIEFQSRRYTPGRKGKTPHETAWDVDACQRMKELKRV